MGERAAAQSPLLECPNGVPCPLGQYSGVSRAANDTIVTAVGCEVEFSVTFGSSFSLDADVSVDMCARASTGICVIKSNTITIDKGVVECCSSAIQDRQCALSEQESELPRTFFDCMQLRTVKRPGSTTATIKFVTPYLSDLSNAEFWARDPTLQGRHEVCLTASEKDSLNNTARSPPHCVPVQVQRCSACLKGGAGLNDLSKRYGTHWTQIYSSNQDITGNPDALDNGRLVRLGPLYEVQDNDTPMQVAVKLGVSVNQLLYWNKHLSLLQDPLASIAPGTILCTMPKTCFNTFGPNQIVFNHRERFSDKEGGAWSDPYQIDEEIFTEADPRPEFQQRPTSPGR
uniref:LysM domain-containing protein n=1 Tax=Hemiselmis tepida TaxID=464990 RepID=A0A7S0VIM3_9CRYP